MEDLFNASDFTHLKCDLCGEVFEKGLMNYIKHQFEDCKAHYIEKTEGFASFKFMPHINPTPVLNDKK